MEYWRCRIVKASSDKTSDRALNLMALVNKMRKGEDIPAELMKWYIIEEDDEASLEALQKSLRRVLNSAEMWSLKDEINNHVSDTEQIAC